jgi:[ribosomal protein S5]-alanine N-acetyltransferase
MKVQLTTDRLLLAPLAPATAAALLDSRERAARELGLDLEPDWPGQALFGILPRQTELPPSQSVWGIWLIIGRAERAVMGDVGFKGPPSRDGVVEIGYSVVPAYRRRGYATEAASALVEWARHQAPVTAIVAGCDENNQASIRTLVRVGFRETGRDGRELRWRL